MLRSALRRAQVARLRSHLDQIKRDDRLIKSEGIEALSEEELRQASRARGMRAPFGEGAAMFMRKQLKEWLDLSLNRQAHAYCVYVEGALERPDSQCASPGCLHGIGPHHGCFTRPVSLS